MCSSDLNLASLLSGNEKAADELTRTGFKPATVEVTKEVPLQSATERKTPGETTLAERRKKASDFIMNIEELRDQQIKEYAKLRAELARVPKKVAEGKADLRMQESVSRLMQQARDLNLAIRSTKPRRDSAEKFLAKALTEYDNGNISEEVFNVIKAAYDKYPDLLDGLLLSVKAAPERGNAAGQFIPWERIDRKSTRLNSSH